MFKLKRNSIAYVRKRKEERKTNPKLKMNCLKYLYLGIFKEQTRTKDE
jgi:hypothetical protein